MPSTSSILNLLPPSFRLGVADADLQVIGEQATIEEEGSSPTMWSWFAEESGRVFQNESPAVGVDRYRRWEEDADLMASLGIRHYRTSISWSRLTLEQGVVNRKAVDWYRRYYQALHERGIRVYGTLYHWELPRRYHDRGGWKNRGTVDRFVTHAENAVRELGDLLDEIFILNEPWCSAHNSFYTGTHAPGETNLKDALIAAHHLLLAQGRAFRRLREMAPEAKIGTVVNVEPAFPQNEDSAEDQRAALLANQYFNNWFLDPLYRGHYPREIAEVYGAQMPEFSAEDLAEIRVGPELHTLGVNYYLGKMVSHFPESPLLYEGIRHPGEKVNGLGWSVFVPPEYPPGLNRVLHWLKEQYGAEGLERIYITENGFAGDSGEADADGVRADPERLDYYRQHLWQMAEAIRDGVPVEGYFAWTFMDNYEWAEGYRPESRFGLVHVERENLRRSLKSSAVWYRDLMAAHQERASDGCG